MMNTLLKVPKAQSNGSSNTEIQAGTSNGQNDENSQTPVVPDDIYSYYEKIEQDDEEETGTKNSFISN